jgi:hypothetical protein
MEKFGVVFGVAAAAAAATAVAY